MHYDIESPRAPIKAWIPPDQIEESALKQLRNTATCPWVVQVSVMPDVHMGVGATIGSVIATRGAISAAACGVDIGCGVDWRLTNLTARDLPDNLDAIRFAVEAVIPTGAGQAHKALVDPTVINAVGENQINGLNDLWPRFNTLAKNDANLLAKAQGQLGTLGSGNHHIELCVSDSDDRVSLLLHSGSRGVGNIIASHHITVAKRLAHNHDLPDPDLAAFLANTPEMASYYSDLTWCQEYARFNRLVMMRLFIATLQQTLPQLRTVEAVSCHHNYVATERYARFGDDPVFVTRKGAVAAHKDQLSAIPGAMGRSNFIVRGLGNDTALNSAAHGAGRRMSRTAARKAFTTADLAAQTRGVSCRKDARIVDEIPSAYKDPAWVMAHQTDLVEIVREFKSVMTIKGD